MRNRKKNKVVVYNIDTDNVETSIDNFLDIVERSAARLRKHVWIVLDWDAARIEGVYATRNAAEIRRARLCDDGYEGFAPYAVLKFKIKGY